MKSSFISDSTEIYNEGRKISQGRKEFSYVKTTQPKQGQTQHFTKINVGASINDDTFSVERLMFQFKYIMLGETSVGKSCIAMKFVNNVFSEKYVCTVGVDYKVKSLNLSDKISADIQIWDTCGQEKFRTITRQYYRDCNAIVLVFDLTSINSFNSLEYWIEELNTFLPNKKDVSIILIGNKCDLLLERQVSSTEANQFARRFNLEYIEVSAKDGTNIYEAFENITWTLVHKEQSGSKSKFNYVTKSERSQNTVDLTSKKNSKNGKCCSN